MLVNIDCFSKRRNCAQSKEPGDMKRKNKKDVDGAEKLLYI